jgi:uncharacterized protein YjiS (DUF1127 family)
MTAIDLQHFGAHRGAAMARTLGDSVERTFASLREWRRRSRTRAELAALDDRMLEDIGITRAEAEFLGDEPFWSGRRF